MGEKSGSALRRNWLLWQANIRALIRRCPEISTKKPGVNSLMFKLTNHHSSDAVARVGNGSL